MKISLIRPFVSAVTAIICVACFLASSSPASAQQSKVKAVFTVSVTVPSDGEPVTYKSKGKTITINPGESAEIPTQNAKEIKLRA